MKLSTHLIICMIPVVSWADAFNEPDTLWKCQARDSTNMGWTAPGNYQRVAANIALEACKQRSENPRSCRVTEASCESFVNGVSTRPMWRCTALDQLAKPWRNNIQLNRDNAALAAKDKCIRHSGMPDTCYINLMTCENLNALPD